MASKIQMDIGMIDSYPIVYELDNREEWTDEECWSNLIQD